MGNLQQWSPSFSDAIAVFRLHCQAQRYSRLTVIFYDTRLYPFSAWLTEQQVMDLRAVTPNHIRAYLVLRQEDGAAPHYMHGIARALRTFFRFCVSEEWLAASPMRNIAMPRLPKTILPAFGMEETQALLKAASDEREKAVLLFLLDTGVRAQDFVMLRGGDIELKTGAVHVREGKGAKDRIVYLGSKSLRALLRYYMQRGVPESGAAIWVGEREPHRPLTYSGLAQLLRRVGRKAGVSHCAAHTFRRTFALQCLRNGMNIYSLRRLMGHEDIDVLKQYLDLLGSDDADAHRRFGVIDNWRL